MSCANLNSNYVQPVTPIPLNNSINSNFEAYELESEEKEKKESRLVINISKLRNIIQIFKF